MATEPRNLLAEMADRVSQRLRDAGVRQVEVDPSQTRLPLVIFRMPLTAKPPLPDARRFAMSETELGKWWLDHSRYSISYEPFDGGNPGFVLIDRQEDFIIWARQGQHPCMQFHDWQGAVRAAIARHENGGKS